MTLPSLQTTLQNWLKKNPFVFRTNWDADTAVHLYEIFTQKQVSLQLNQIRQFRESQNTQGFGTYMNLVLESNIEIILSHAGFAFSPVFANTGPITDAPPVVCLQDYFRLYQSLQHLLHERERKTDTLNLFRLLISILDGAKAIGLDVTAEEQNLEKCLAQFETSFNQ